MEDASLDDFLGTAADDESSEAQDAESGPDADDDADRADGEPVEPAATTAAWRPGAVCDDCGVAAERRWDRDGELVCADCKEW